MRKFFGYCIIAVLVLILAFPSSGCGGTASGSGTYTNSKHGFTVNYPEDWELDEGADNTIVVFRGPVLQETGGKVNINITNDEIGDSSNITLDFYLDLNDKQYVQEFENYSRLATEDMTIDGKPAKKMIYSFDSANFSLKANQVYLIDDGTAFAITFVTTAATYDRYAADSDLVINSFKLN